MAPRRMPRKSGVAHLTAADEEAVIEDARYLLTFLPQNNLESPPYATPSDPVDREAPELDTLIPDSPNKPYDMKHVIEAVVDEGAFLEIQPRFAREHRLRLRAARRARGRRRRQPAPRARRRARHRRRRQGAHASCARATRSTYPSSPSSTCPASSPGTAQEWGGIIRHGAKLLYAYAEATVPKLTVITRKAYGGAYDVMSSKHIRADFNVAWPTAEVAVMGPDGAVNIVFRSELAEASDPDARRDELVADYKERFANPYAAAERGYVDDVIEPRRTRPVLVSALETALTKREPGPKRKHGNIPL